MTTEVLASAQLLNAKRYAAYNKLCETRGRSMKAAEITKKIVAGKFCYFFDEVQILELDTAATTELLGRGLIREMHGYANVVRDSVKAILDESIELPAGHEWFMNDGRVSDLLLSNNTSIYICRIGRDMYDSQQFSAEFRLFPNELKGHLFLDHGPQYAFKATKLLKESEPFVYASSVEEMAHQMIERYRIGMQRHVDMVTSVAA